MGHEISLWRSGLGEIPPSQTLDACEIFAGRLMMFWIQSGLLSCQDLLFSPMAASLRVLGSRQLTCRSCMSKCDLAENAARIPD